MTWQQIVLVAVGAAVGGPARFWLDRIIQLRLLRNDVSRPALGILAVNVVGSTTLGLVLAHTSGNAMTVLGVGFCGAFTTYATFAAQTAESWRSGFPLAALGNVAVNTALCLAAFWAAWSTG